MKNTILMAKYFYYNVCVTKLKKNNPRETTLGIRSNVDIYKYTL
jgi:hypothetical protein